MSDIGITSYGAYIPRKRLNRKAIADSNAWMNGALRGLGKGTKAICNWDEDALTMAVEAVRNCIAGGDTDGISALYFASTTHPFVDRHNAGIITAALNMPDDIRSLDIAAPNVQARLPSPRVSPASAVGQQSLWHPTHARPSRVLCRKCSSVMRPRPWRLVP